MNVGDGFYVFRHELFGRGYELEKRWITQVLPGRVSHIGGAVGSTDDIGGAVGSTDDTSSWPWRGNPDPKKAFMGGKARALIGLAGAKAELRKKLADLLKEEKKLRALKFEDVRQRGNGETYEQFKRNWDNDI